MEHDRTQFGNHAVLHEVVIDCNGHELQSKTALERASLMVIDKIRELSSDEAEQITIFPVDFVHVARLASDQQVQLLARTLRDCVTVTDRVTDFDNIIDEELSNAFTFASYSAFYNQESPAKIEGRLASTRVVLRVVAEDVRRVGLLRLCKELVMKTSISDSVASIFLLGGRHNTIEQLLEYESILTQRVEGYNACRYHFDRKEWTQYPAASRRGQISWVVDDEQMSYFQQKFWDWIDSGDNVISASVQAYLNLLDYFVVSSQAAYSIEPISIDAFVKTLLRNHINQMIESETNVNVKVG
ncbi:hypothetical protein AB9X29_003718 [Vibrio vulnificus]